MKEEKNKEKEENKVSEKPQTAKPEEKGETNVKDKKENELETAKKLVEEYKDKWMRSVAEFDNYKKRNARLYQDAYADGKSDVIIKILPVGDNLDTAINMGLDEKTTEGLKLLK